MIRADKKHMTKTPILSQSHIEWIKTIIFLLHTNTENHIDIGGCLQRVWYGDAFEQPQKSLEVDNLVQEMPKLEIITMEIQSTILR